MGPDPKLFDDIARVAGGAVNVVSGLQNQIRDEIRSRVEEMAARMDLVPREDLERAEAMIESLRKQIDDIDSRLAALEGKKKTTAKKAATKKTAGKTTKKAVAQRKAAPNKKATAKASHKKAPAKKAGKNK